MNAEKARLAAADGDGVPWRFWGPYVSERQWGTVREDYSPGGAAWEYFPHDHARSRAYRWGEDGIAGISDDKQRLCLALAMWNGNDPILKERFFGLTNSEGNHGEDVKEAYFHLDATPTHSYLKMLYKYPQQAFPYSRLVEENRRRGKSQPEFELLDTGIFDDDRYFDVFIEYAKAGPEDILMRITAHNRGAKAADLFLLPQLWFRNSWSWNPNSARPVISRTDPGAVTARHPEIGDYVLHSDGKPQILFCENDTNVCRLHRQNEATGYFKDGFDEYVVRGNEAAVNSQGVGTKAGFLHKLKIPGAGSTQIRLRLTRSSGRPSAPSDQSRLTSVATNAFTEFDVMFTRRIQEADEFYAELQTGIHAADERDVQRQALAGMMWNKQFYGYQVREWLEGDSGHPSPPSERTSGRNCDWRHLHNACVMSMPDKWEYPWYAAWDLAFHCIPLALVDATFAKYQLTQMTREWYMHPNGQFPAYEWGFGDVNPPVHAWATWRVFQMDRKQRRETNPRDNGDLEFLERVYHKLLLNFTWWVNRKDVLGRNIFQGGFLGLDNIGVLDRSQPLPNGGHLNQADGTSWMAMYCLNLLRIALELAQHNRVYEDIASKFFQHFLDIAAAINGTGQSALGLWDPADEFYYDHLSLPDGQNLPMKIRSMVGLIPLFAVEVLEPSQLKKLPGFTERMEWYLNFRPDLAKLVSRWHERASGERSLLSLLRGHRMKCLLRRALDETEFLSDHGVRALSKAHEDEPFRMDCGGQVHEVCYWPAESQNGLFGGNSNWRGPVWMPVNFLLIESLQKFHHYYGNDFKLECPTGSGRFMTLNDIANELTRRLTGLFLKGKDGQRPVLKYHPKQATDPHFRDYVLFHEYFHGDSGRGVGASHQTGWTGLIAKLIQPRASKAKPPAAG
jgi:hypothetical protein